jgi:hypothetical protein
MTNQQPKSWRTGGCHCGDVRFEVNIPDQVTAISCNCSICASTGFIHVIVEGPDFKQTSGDDKLSVYTFNSHIAKHTFCSKCGVKAFYVPRSHPNGVSVNLRCINTDQNINGQIVDFDGANWTDSIDAIEGDKGLAS